MNPDDFHVTGPVYLFFLKLLDWLTPIIHVIGLGVSVWAFKRSRKRGYIVVGIYFGLCLFSLLAMPTINSAIRSRRPPNVSEEMSLKLHAAVEEAAARVREEYGNPSLPSENKIDIPFGATVLVLGVWLIARREHV